jgi:diguanylate cyclase (GGDEF)-like protein
VSPTWTTVASTFAGALVGALAGAALTGAVVGARLARSRRALHTVAHQLIHDPLTGLPNRHAFGDQLEVELRRGTAVAVAIDLDRFKAVNDRYGHHAGDQVLCQVADRLRALPEPVRLVARLQGDEFLLLTDVGRAGADAAWRAIAAEPFTVDGRLVAITASIGVAVAAPGTTDPRWLLTAADTAMYRAKTTGAGVAIADPQGSRPVVDRPPTRLRDARPPPDPTGDR